MKNWIVLGIGHAVNDIIETIELLGTKVERILINHPIPTTVVIPQIELISIENFVWSKDHNYCFGFLNPKKKEWFRTLDPSFFPNIIHPTAAVSRSARLGVGNYLGPQSALAANSVLGNLNHLNRCASVGHESRIGDFNHLGPGAVVCGMCKIGNENFLGANATLIDRINIKDNITLGAGGVCCKNIDEPGIYVGMPAKKLVKKDAGS
jgi:sugar O-acyltransferase (sialic acid O-acetyltransferase NeuD family)